LKVDYRALMGGKGEAVMSVFKNQGAHDRSNCVVRGGRVLLYEKGTTRPEAVWIDYGAAVLDRALIERQGQSAPGGVFDLAALYGRLARERRLGAFEVTERFYEIGSPGGLAELEAMLRTQPR
jgi:hypothetical protein